MVAPLKMKYGRRVKCKSLPGVFTSVETNGIVFENCFHKYNRQICEQFLGICVIVLGIN